ncbi:hypothetical protein B0H14DRAFT_3894124 [Mycena olivaceomarginata]|nr:hypothetical protein B0H14DRAFT_3894124 [Mycena olivaceomarginata]
MRPSTGFPGWVWVWVWVWVCLGLCASTTIVLLPVRMHRRPVCVVHRAPCLHRGSRFPAAPAWACLLSIFIRPRLHSSTPLQRTEKRASNNKICINPNPAEKSKVTIFWSCDVLRKKKKKKKASRSLSPPPPLAGLQTHLTIRRPSNFTSKIWLVWLSRTTRIAPLPPPALALAGAPAPRAAQRPQVPHPHTAVVARAHEAPAARVERQRAHERFVPDERAQARAWWRRTRS